MNTRQPRPRHHRRLLGIALAAALAVASCGGDSADSESSDSSSGTDTSEAQSANEEAADSDADEGTQEGSAAPSEAENQTIRVGVATLEDQIPDQHLQTGGNKLPIKWSISEGLVRPDVEGGFVPNLATEWETSEDGLTWTITLREGVQFQDGSELTAQDVVTAVERVEGSEDFVPFNQFKRFVEGAEVVDDYTATITTNEPYPTLMKDAPDPIPTEYYQEVGDEGFRKQPIGTGAFKFEEQELNSSMTFSRFDDFWDDTRMPNFETLVLEIIPEESARVAALQSGEIDYAGTLSANSATQLEGAGIEVVETPGTAIGVIGIFEMLEPDSGEPLTDLRVRKALMLALDRQGMIDSLYGGYGVVPNNIHPPTTLGALDLEPYPYDPEEAKRLLAEAGQEDLAFTLHSYNETTTIADVTRLIEAIAQSWREIGIDVTLDISDAGTYLPKYRNKEYESGLGFLSFPSFDAVEPNFYSIFYVPSGYYPTLDDPEMTRILDAIATTVDEEERAALGSEMSQYMYDNLPALPIVAPSTLVGIGPNIAEYTPLAGNPYAGPFWYLRAN